MRTCYPGPTVRVVVQDALRVTVVPELVTYATSRPFRSAEDEPRFASSTYSSDAAPPPVTISATTRPVDGGQLTAAAGPMRARRAPGGDAATPSSRTTRNAAYAASRARAIEDLRAGRRRRVGARETLRAPTYLGLNAPTGSEPVRCTGRALPARKPVCRLSRRNRGPREAH